MDLSKQAHSDESEMRHGVVVALRREDGLWLVVRRAASLDRAPGKVGFPGGEVEVGESQEDAVVREMREELGVHVTPIMKFWEADDQVPGFVLHGWLAGWLSPMGQVEPDLDEVAEVLWLTPEEIVADPDAFSGNQIYVAALLAACA